jgi:hypothetical protein
MSPEPGRPSVFRDAVAAPFGAPLYGRNENLGLLRPFESGWDIRYLPEPLLIRPRNPHI